MLTLPAICDIACVCLRRLRVPRWCRVTAQSGQPHLGGHGRLCGPSCQQLCPAASTWRKALQTPHGMWQSFAKSRKLSGGGQLTGGYFTPLSMESYCHLGRLAWDANTCSLRPGVLCVLSTAVFKGNETDYHRG
jgi:hypothetical protein